jgi:hypothetical protein
VKLHTYPSTTTNKLTAERMPSAFYNRPLIAFGLAISCPIFLYVKLIRSPTGSSVFGTSCFQNYCIVPAMMISVPLPTTNVLVSFVALCRIRNVRVAPNDKEPITLPIPGSLSACHPTLSDPDR